MSHGKPESFEDMLGAFAVAARTYNDAIARRNNALAAVATHETHVASARETYEELRRRLDDHLRPQHPGERPIEERAP